MTQQFYHQPIKTKGTHHIMGHNFCIALRLYFFVKQASRNAPNYLGQSISCALIVIDPADTVHINYPRGVVEETPSNG